MLQDKKNILRMKKYQNFFSTQKPLNFVPRTEIGLRTENELTEIQQKEVLPQFTQYGKVRTPNGNNHQRYQNDILNQRLHQRKFIISFSDF